MQHCTLPQPEASEACTPEHVCGYRTTEPCPGGHSPHDFRGYEQLVALKVFPELTQGAAVGDFFPKLVTEGGETRELDNRAKERGLHELGCRMYDRLCTEIQDGSKALEAHLHKITCVQFELAVNLHRAGSTGAPFCVEWTDLS